MNVPGAGLFSTLRGNVIQGTQGDYDQYANFTGDRATAQRRCLPSRIISLLSDNPEDMRAAERGVCDRWESNRDGGFHQYHPNVRLSSCGVRLRPAVCGLASRRVLRHQDGVC